MTLSESESVSESVRWATQAWHGMTRHGTATEHKHDITPINNICTSMRQKSFASEPEYVSTYKVSKRVAVIDEPEENDNTGHAQY